MRMPWGKFAGQPLTEIPAGYLCWALESASLTEELADELRRELLDRFGGERQPRCTRALPNPSIGAAAGEIIATGFRSVAARVHPDHGGDDAAMRDALAARDWLRTALRTGIAA